jgi:hypothetical protein
MQRCNSISLENQLLIGEIMIQSGGQILLNRKTFFLQMKKLCSLGIGFYKNSIDSIYFRY